MLAVMSRAAECWDLHDSLHVLRSPEKDASTAEQDQALEGECLASVLREDTMSCRWTTVSIWNCDPEGVVRGCG
jgi:hypothetical protein